MYFQSSYLLQFLNLLTSIKTYKIALQLFATLTFRRLNTINDANISHYLAGQLYLVLVKFSWKPSACHINHLCIFTIECVE